MNTDSDHSPALDKIAASKPGAIVPFSKIAEAANGNARFMAIAETIHMQMGLYHTRNEAIKSGWAIQGKFREGGDMIRLAPKHVRENGNIFCVSYHYGRDDYTITYGIHEDKNIAIIEERDEIHADMLCMQFTKITGVEIPIVAFG